jgi:hypothetical protein
MMIRVKYDGKTRKGAQVPATIEDLRKKIADWFDSEASKQELVYKDCDGELVSVVDSEDLKNCVAEAEVYKMTCITLLVKEPASKTRAPRSVSSKKKASETSETSEATESNTSDSDDSSEERALVKAKAQEEAELIKKKLIEEHQKALAQLEMETQAKISDLEKKKEKKLKESSADKKDRKERKKSAKKDDKEKKVKEDKGEDKGKRREERLAEKARRQAEKEARKLQKEAEKAEKKAQKAEEKLAKRPQKDNVDEKEAKIRAKVTELREQFPNVKRPQLRAIVIQNPTLTPQELAPMIKASKVAQSSYK